MSRLLVIFDLDGTLIDSETLCNQAFLDLIPSLNETVEQLVDQFRGKKLAEILSEIERKIPSSLPENFEHIYRQRVADAFATELKPVKGVPDMLKALELPFCIASSGPSEKIKHALAVTGLTPFFGERYFSSYTVVSWKPDPGLFLYAAKAMGFAPENCIVIEDSVIGLEAAASAGMHAFHYAPQAKTEKGINTFSSMSELPSILHELTC
ncbi:HAD-IA family hydrolase [Methylophilus flavus]|uniref:HAD-IA family hydrolase n=1 Tax=Methylophilus flavus TaxID=640084 RepID=A0ABW3P5U9_9PROT